MARKILITGCTGVVGSEILKRFRSDELIALTHQKPVPDSHIETITGDVSLPYLGLGWQRYDALSRKVSCIVNCSAITDFRKSPQRIWDVNVNGVAHQLDFAGRAEARFYQVSTAYVNLPHTDGHAYLASKREAERLIKRSNIPGMIIRPSIVVGRSDTGEIQCFQGFYRVIHGILKGAFPMLPIGAKALIDFIPVDFVADAIAARVRDKEIGGEVWLTAGPHAITARQFADSLVEFASSELGLRIEPPKLIPASVFERLIRPMLEQVEMSDPQAQKRVRGFEKQLNWIEPLCLHRMATSPFSSALKNLPPPQRSLQVSLTYWLSHAKVRFK